MLQSDAGICEFDIVNRQQRAEILDRRIAFGTDEFSVTLNAAQIEELSNRFPELCQCHPMGRLHDDFLTDRFLGSALGS